MKHARPIILLGLTLTVLRADDAPGPATNPSSIAISGDSVTTPASDPVMGDPPSQTPCEPWSMEKFGFTLHAKASYCVIGRVALSHDYQQDAFGDIVPFDFVLSWGAGVNKDFLAYLNLSQGDRQFAWHAGPDLIPSVSEVMQMMANTHLIPRNAAIAAKIARVNDGDLILIRGYLVDLSNADGFHWPSSLVRDDIEEGACELMLVDSLEVLPQNAIKNLPAYEFK